MVMHNMLPACLMECVMLPIVPISDPPIHPEVPSEAKQQTSLEACWQTADGQQQYQINACISSVLEVASTLDPIWSTAGDMDSNLEATSNMQSSFFNVK